MTMEATCIFSSSACNKSPHAIDWGKNNILCISACNAVHLYKYDNIQGGKCIQTLLTHKKTVTSIHWVKKLYSTSDDELLVTSADNTASIWKNIGQNFQLNSVLVGHSNVVRNGTAMYLPTSEDDLLVVTLSIDSTVKVWIRNVNCEVNCIQTICLGNGFGLDAKLTTLGENNELVLIMSQDDSRIHIYMQDKDKIFVPKIKLSGHEDWVQSIDVLKQDEVTLRIASASQDCHIRIWKVSPNLVDDSLKSTDLKVDAIKFQTVSDELYSVSLESVLSGHENWIYSVQWRTCEDNNKESTGYQLLSASMDKTVIIWEPDTNSDIWLEKVRFGDVGGNTLGFFGALFSPCGEIVVSHGHQGAIHFWKIDKDGDCWSPSLSFSGHHSSVSDISWDPDGDFIVSCSLDQTTRLFAPYVTRESENSWYEIARPQIHGYDMVCLTMLNRFQYVSAGDEKVLRVFGAPQNFADTLETLVKVDTSTFNNTNLAVGASVPSLGLSNKAVFKEDINKLNEDGGGDSERHPKDKFPDFYFTPTHSKEPPTEETLLQNTLWPEVHKLYGHPYEVFTVASNHSSTLVASACKASKSEHAGIILWSTSTWRQVTYLQFHALTVTQMEFSPDDEYLLSVSRDRMWALYQHCPDDEQVYKKVAHLDRKSGVHTRIIWSCSWSFDSFYFATSSRDKKVAVWGRENGTEFALCLEPLEVEDSATAVSFAPSLVDKKYLIAIGLENGLIILSLWSHLEGWNVLQKLEHHIAHHLNVNKLKFSPVSGAAGCKKKNPNILQLASCSNDHHVKIYNICISMVT